MVRWVAAWLCLAAAAFGIARVSLTPSRNAWWLIGATSDDSVIVARLATGNTGLFADQLTSRITVLRPDHPPLEHRVLSGPASATDQGIESGSDVLRTTPTGIEWSIGGEGLRLRGEADAASLECPPGVGPMRGVVDLPEDYTEGEGFTARGRAMVVRTQARGQTRATSLYALSTQGGLGIDPLAECPGWLRLGSDARAATAPPLPGSLVAPLELDFAGHSVWIEPGRRTSEHHPLAPTLSGERLLSRLMGFPAPVLTLQRVWVRVDGGVPWAGVMIFRGQE